MKQLRKRINWRSGGGELLGFAIILPTLVLLISFISSAAQITITNQNLEYAAYNCCRSAVVCTSMEEGINNAENSYYTQMGSINESTYGYDGCTLETLGGAGWEKGNYVKCTVRYYISTAMPFTTGVREQSIVMMIENGAVH